MFASRRYFQYYTDDISIIAPKETSFDWPILCFYAHNFSSLGSRVYEESLGQSYFSTLVPRNHQVKLQI